MLKKLLRHLFLLGILFLPLIVIGAEINKTDTLTEKEANTIIQDKTDTKDEEKKELKDSVKGKISEVKNDERVKNEFQDKNQGKESDKIGEKKEIQQKRLESENDNIKNEENKSSEKSNTVEKESDKKDKSDVVIKDEKDKSLEKDKKEKEYLGIFFGYGGFIPISDYGTRYHAGHLFSATLSLYYFSLWNISPEIHVRYAGLDSIKKPLRVDSNITFFQVFPGLVYRHEVGIPFLKKALTLYARIWDGLSRVSYKSDNPINPLYGKIKIVENINVFGLSGGFTYPVYKNFMIGVDASYSVVATADIPCQSFSVMLNVGVKM